MSQWVNAALDVLDATPRLHSLEAAGPPKLPEARDSQTILRTKPEFCQKSSLPS